jgi:hypothetical protein
MEDAMVRWEVTRAPASVLLLTRLGVDYGLSAEICLRRTGIREEMLRDPNLTVTAEQELTVVANLLDALGDPPGLGLEAGIRYHLTTYGIWGFAMISSPSWRSAIDVGLRYLDLTFAFTRIVARDRGDEFHLVLDTPDIPPALQRFVVERDSSAIQTIQHELFASPIPIREMRYTFPPPAGDAHRYTEIFGVEPVFDAGESAVGLDPAILDRPLPQANEHTAAMAQAQCRELLSKRLTRTGVAGLVRGQLMARPSAPPDIDRVAAALHMSDRRCAASSPTRACLSAACLTSSASNSPRSCSSPAGCRWRRSLSDWAMSRFPASPRPSGAGRASAPGNTGLAGRLAESSNSLASAHLWPGAVRT